MNHNTHSVPQNEQAAVRMARGATLRMIRDLQTVANGCGVNPRALIISAIVSTLQEFRLLDDMKKCLKEEES